MGDALNLTPNSILDRVIIQRDFFKIGRYFEMQKRVSQTNKQKDL